MNNVQKNVFLILLVNFQNCAAIKKKLQWFQNIPLIIPFANWTIYNTSLLKVNKVFFLNLKRKKKGGGVH